MTGTARLGMGLKIRSESASATSEVAVAEAADDVIVILFCNEFTKRPDKSDISKFFVSMKFLH